MFRAPCGVGESSYVLYRHKFHGLFIAGILREAERDGGRRDGEEILRGEGKKCKVGIPEVFVYNCSEEKFSSFCVPSPLLGSSTVTSL